MPSYLFSTSNFLTILLLYIPLLLPLPLPLPLSLLLPALFLLLLFRFLLTARGVHEPQQDVTHILLSLGVEVKIGGGWELRNGGKLESCLTVVEEEEEEEEEEEVEEEEKEEEEEEEVENIKRYEAPQV